MSKITNKQNRKRLIDAENKLIVVRGEGVFRGSVKKVKGLRKKQLIDTDSSMVMTREKSEGKGVERGRRR